MFGQIKLKLFCFGSGWCGNQESPRIAVGGDCSNLPALRNQRRPRMAVSGQVMRAQWPSKVFLGRAAKPKPK